jgi:hypothetical protein
MTRLIVDISHLGEATRWDPSNGLATLRGVAAGVVAYSYRIAGR